MFLYCLALTRIHFVWRHVLYPELHSHLDTGRENLFLFKKNKKNKSTAPQLERQLANLGMEISYKNRARDEKKKKMSEKASWSYVLEKQIAANKTQQHWGKALGTDCWHLICQSETALSLQWLLWHSQTARVNLFHSSVLMIWLGPILNTTWSHL